MSWSLDYQPAKEATRLEHFFSVSGRALYLASSFELKCREILRIVKLHHHYDETNDWSASMALSRALRGKMLSEIIRQLKLLTEIQESDISTLEKAKTARNFIAHELGALSPISSIFASSIEERLDTLSAEKGTGKRGRIYLWHSGVGLK